MYAYVYLYICTYINKYMQINVCTYIYTHRFRSAVDRVTLQSHTATHCNTLQHTATHCNTLQHTAAHCNTLQHTATHCNTLTLSKACTCMIIYLYMCTSVQYLYTYTSIHYLYTYTNIHIFTKKKIHMCVHIYLLTNDRSTYLQTMLGESQSRTDLLSKACICINVYINTCIHV